MNAKERAEKIVFGMYPEKPSNHTDNWFVEQISKAIEEAEREAVETYQKSPERQEIRDIDFEYGFRAAQEKAAKLLDEEQKIYRRDGYISGPAERIRIMTND